MGIDDELEKLNERLDILEKNIRLLYKGEIPEDDPESYIQNKEIE